MIYDGASSSIKQVTCSVPQGSVLGPLLFLLYSANLADLAAKHGVTVYAFVDDTRLNIHCKLNNMATSRDVLELCTQVVGHWMSANRLKLTQTKQNCCGPELDTASVDSSMADLGWCSVPKLLMLRDLYASSE